MKRQTNKNLISYGTFALLLLTIFVFANLLNVVKHEFSYDKFISYLNNGEVTELKIIPRANSSVYEITGKLEGYKKNESFTLVAPLSDSIISNILEGLTTLDKIIPGVANDDTLLYGPEIKFFSNEIETDNNFKLKNDNIYFIGDGAGKAGNIVTAAATGLVAARDILGSIKK